MAELKVIEGNFEPEPEVEAVPMHCSACGWPQFNWAIATTDEITVHTLRCTGCGEYHCFSGEIDIEDFEEED